MLKLPVLRQKELPSAQEVERELYKDIEEGVLSGEALFALQEEFEFTRPGLHVRRVRAFEDLGVPPGTAARAAGNLALTLANMLDMAGRQKELDNKTIAPIGTHAMAFSILMPEMDELIAAEDYDLSAVAMSEIIERQYADWYAFPPDRVEAMDDGEGSVLISARIVQSGLDLLQEKLINEANAAQ